MVTVNNDIVTSNPIFQEQDKKKKKKSKTIVMERDRDFNDIAAAGTGDFDDNYYDEDFI